MSKKTNKSSFKKGNGKVFKDVRSKNSRPLGKPTNAPDFYYPTKEIQQLAAAISMNNRNGDSVRMADNVNLHEYSRCLNRLPGVFSNVVIHTPGRTTAPTDPTNEAARSMMNRIREQINSNRHYEMPDLVKYAIALGDFFSWCEFLKLVYKVCNKFNVLNRYTPTAILRALYIDTSDVNNLRIQLKAYIERLAQRVANFKLPTEFKFCMAWIEDFKHVFVDEDIAKAQYIVNVPGYIWKYTINSTTSLSELVRKDYRLGRTFNNPYSVQDLMNITEDLLVEIVNDEDFAIITGDVMKAYSSFYSFDISDLDNIVEFEYSKEYLEKWHNSAQFDGLLNAAVTVSDYKIVEDTSTYLDPFIKFDPTFTCNNATTFLNQRRGAGNRIVDFYDKEVSDDQVINACLWMFSLSDLDETAKTYKFNPVSTSSVITSDIIYYDHTNTLVNSNYLGMVAFSRESTGNVIPNAYLEGSIIQLSKWNYAPITIVLVATNSQTASDTGLYGLLGDFGNYAILDQRILENIKLCILYGQFNVQALLS